MGFKESFMKQVERNNKNVINHVKKELRKKSDDQVRNIIYNGPNAVGRDLAREEADRRGISY